MDAKYSMEIRLTPWTKWTIYLCLFLSYWTGRCVYFTEECTFITLSSAHKVIASIAVNSMRKSQFKDCNSICKCNIDLKYSQKCSKLLYSVTSRLLAVILCWVSAAGIDVPFEDQQGATTADSRFVLTNQVSTRQILTWLLGEVSHSQYRIEQTRAGNEK